MNNYLKQTYPVKITNNKRLLKLKHFFRISFIFIFLLLISIVCIEIKDSVATTPADTSVGIRFNCLDNSPANLQRDKTYRNPCAVNCAGSIDVDEWKEEKLGGQQTWKGILWTLEIRQEGETIEKKGFNERKNTWRSCISNAECPNGTPLIVIVKGVSDKPGKLILDMTRNINKWAFYPFKKGDFFIAGRNPDRIEFSEYLYEYKNKKKKTNKLKPEITLYFSEGSVTSAHTYTPDPDIVKFFDFLGDELGVEFFEKGKNYANSQKIWKISQGGIQIDSSTEKIKIYTAMGIIQLIEEKDYTTGTLSTKDCLRNWKISTAPNAMVYLKQNDNVYDMQHADDKGKVVFQVPKIDIISGKCTISVFKQGYDVQTKEIKSFITPGFNRISLSKSQKLPGATIKRFKITGKQNLSALNIELSDIILEQMDINGRALSKFSLSEIEFISPNTTHYTITPTETGAAKYLIFKTKQRLVGQLPGINVIPEKRKIIIELTSNLIQNWEAVNLSYRFHSNQPNIRTETGQSRIIIEVPYDAQQNRFKNIFLNLCLRGFRQNNSEIDINGIAINSESYPYDINDMEKLLPETIIMLGRSQNSNRNNFYEIAVPALENVVRNYVDGSKVRLGYIDGTYSAFLNSNRENLEIDEEGETSSFKKELNGLSLEPDAGNGQLVQTIVEIEEKFSERRDECGNLTPQRLVYVGDGLKKSDLGQKKLPHKNKDKPEVERYIITFDDTLDTDDNKLYLKGWDQNHLKKINKQSNQPSDEIYDHLRNIIIGE